MKNTIITAAVLAAGISAASAAITYVDATTANTTLADGSAYNPSTSSSGSTNNNEWHIRTGFGNDSAIYASHYNNTSTPEIRTTITGLAAGNYNLYTFYWVAGEGAPIGNNEWNISTGLTQGATTNYSWNGGTQTQLTDFDTAVLISEGNRRLFKIDLGTVTVDGSGEANIYIADHPGNDDRTWYDGVGYEAVAVPEPSSAAFLVLGGLALILRRHK